VTKADPLPSGDNDAQRAPTLLTLSARNPRNLPSARMASATRVNRSRPWKSVRNTSERVEVYLTGRPSLRDAHNTSPDST